MVDRDLLAHLEGYLTERRKNLFVKVLAERTRHFTVAVEDVYQLHNTSAVLRSCDVFGLQDVHVIEERLGKKMDREIAMGAQKWVDIHRYNNTKSCIARLRNEGYRIVATTPHTNSQYLHEFDTTQKAAFFFGKEREGLSDEVLSEADEFLKIPMVGFTESLNISVSAAITIQHVTTKLRNSSISWRLTEAEILEKRLDWCKKSIRSIDDILSRYYEPKS
ncbi:tRNA (guanosine-2'-O-)-methyltransferase [Kordia periserrulae]|uniref:tRNA (guanosine(18)-2'-O)-methyltransferase n=1 Tax=Kordia periserrulae TaxID=701523 RepID=A0A2T6C3J4_9FLAO|nr:RNA methyltransferase [Kordia periserrulae]PTX62906.1 tRNA (guanosine-2'-O-)-methyltransferase [Kordia periserrulae]